MQKNARKIIAIMATLALLVLQIPLAASAQTITWGEENLVAGQGDITVNDYNTHYLPVALDADTTYEFSFDMTVNAISTTNLGVILRQGDGEGVYMDFWFGLNQIRLGEAIDGSGWNTEACPNDSLVNGTVAFEEGKTYSLRIVMEPEKITYYIDNQLMTVTLGAAGGYATQDYTLVKKITNASIGFIGQNAAPNATISNIVLKKGTVWSDNLVEDQSDIILNDYTARYLPATLDANATYALDFDMTIHSLASTNIAAILRQGDSEGIYMDFWFSQGQIRLGEDINGLGFGSNDHPDDTIYSMTFEEEKTYSLHILLEPEKVTYYIDGQLINVTMGPNGGYAASSYSIVKKIENASIGFVGQNAAPNATISNISLIKDVNSGGESAVDEGWTENMVTGATSMILNNYNARYLDAVLDANSTYRLDFKATFNALSTSNLAIILRENDNIGYYLDIWAAFTHFRLGQDINGLSWPNGSIVTNLSLVEGKEYAFSILLEPEKVTYSIDGVIVRVTLGEDSDAPYQESSYTPMQKVEDARIGFVAQNSAPNITLSGISLCRKLEAFTGDINGDGSVTSDDLVLMRQMLLGVKDQIQYLDFEYDVTAIVTMKKLIAA